MTAPLKVFYDGACPVCRREIAFYRNRPGADRLDWIDVGHGDAQQLGPDLTRDAALARMHVRRPDGTLLSGAAAFGELWRHTPGFGWLGRLVGWAPIGALAELAYRCFLVVRKLWR